MNDCRYPKPGTVRNILFACMGQQDPLVVTRSTAGVDAIASFCFDTQPLPLNSAYIQRIWQKFEAQKTCDINISDLKAKKVLPAIC